MMMTESQFAQRLRETAGRIENLLRDILAEGVREGEILRPGRLLGAMRHGALNGGKRIRPFLLVESAALFEHSGAEVFRVAAALECVHCYSLIHDDLPAMDDDDTRRGRPTVHKAFDEATAILAGDSLLTLAFDILATPETELAPARRCELVLGLARAAGMGGMAGGQMLDLEAESSRPDEERIITLQAMKTGALFRFSCEAGAILSGAAGVDRDRLGEFGSAIGLAFQLSDDLLDATGDSQEMGKAAGKDAAAGKATLTSLHGIEWTRRQLHGLVEQAIDLLEPYGRRREVLSAAARFIAGRTS